MCGENIGLVFAICVISIKSTAHSCEWIWTEFDFTRGPVVHVLRIALQNPRKSRDRSFPGCTETFFSATSRCFLLSLTSRTSEEKRRLARVPRCLKVAGVCLQANALPVESISHGGTGVVVVVVSNNSYPVPCWVSPFLSPLPASFYRAGRGIASAKIAAASVCVRTYDFNTPGELADPSPPIVAFPRDVQIAGDRGRKREAEATCQKLRRDYGRRNIVADAAVARACCAKRSMQIAGKFRCNGSGNQSRD